MSVIPRKKAENVSDVLMRTVAANVIVRQDIKFKSLFYWTFNLI